MNVEKAEVNDNGTGILIVSNGKGMAKIVRFDVMEETAKFEAEPDA